MILQLLSYLLAFIAIGDDEQLPENQQVDLDSALSHLRIGSLHKPASWLLQHVPDELVHAILCQKCAIDQV